LSVVSCIDSIVHGAWRDTAGSLQGGTDDGGRKSEGR